MTELFRKKLKHNLGRRGLAMAAAVLLAAGTLAGCGEGTPAGETDSVQEESVGEAAKGRYMETEVTLPEKVKDMHLLTAIQEEDQSIRVYFYDGKSEYFCYTYDGADWTENKEVPELPDEIKMSRIFRGEDGKLYAGGHGEGYTFHLFEILESGEAVNVFEDVFKVPEGKEYGPIPDYMNVLENGNLLMSEVSGAGVYDPSGKKLFSLSQEFIGMDMRLPACAGADYYLTMDDGGGRLVLYDTNTGMESGSFDIPEKTMENRLNMLLFEDGEGGFYASGPSGLYHTGKDGTIWEQLIDGTLNSMSRQDLIGRGFFEGSDGSYYGIYAGIGDEKLLFLRYAFDSTVDTVPPDTVSVYSLRDNKAVRQAANILQKNNPQVRVDFRIAVEDENEAVTEDVIRALNTELLNGKGADVLILDGLPAESYREKGILADMTALADSLKPELLPNVAEEFDTEEGKVYYLPARLMLPVTYGEQGAVEARRSLDKMKEYQGAAPLFSADIYENMLRQTAYTCYQEIFREDGSTDADALSKLLESVKAAGEQSNARTEYTESEMKRFNVNNSVLPDGFGRQDAYSLVLGECAAAVEVLDSLDSAMLPCSAAGKGGYTIQDVNGIYMPATLVGINASSANQAGAEEFVKTLFGNEVQEQSLWNGFPVRSESLEKWKEMEKNSIVSIGSNANDISLEGQWPAASERAELVELVKKVRTPVIVDQSVMQMIVDGSKNYLDGKETLEGAVSSIENKIRIYMAERE